MIYADSRYAKGLITKVQDPRNDVYRLAVYRKFPTARAQFYWYTWVQGDRIDIVASELLGSPNFWWKIMDFNPEIIDPFSIPVGTILRIPSV
jgi:hypothetical protein